MKSFLLLIFYRAGGGHGPLAPLDLLLSYPSSGSATDYFISVVVQTKVDIFLLLFCKHIFTVMILAKTYFKHQSMLKLKRFDS